MSTTYKEPTVTIKMTLTELKTLNGMVTKFPDERLPLYVVKLRKELIDMEKQLDDKVHKAEIDKRISEEGSEEQTQMETSQRICISCED